MRRLLALAILLTLSACASTTPADQPADSVYGSWGLVAFETGDGIQQVNPDVPYIFRLSPDAERNVSGLARGFDYRGTMALDGETVTSIPVVVSSPRVSSSRQPVAVENYLDQLRQAQRVVREGDDLVIYDEIGRDVLRFRRLM